MIERRVMGNCHARCGVVWDGEKAAIISKPYLSLLFERFDRDSFGVGCGHGNILSM